MKLFRFFITELFRVSFVIILLFGTLEVLQPGIVSSFVNPVILLIIWFVSAIVLVLLPASPAGGNEKEDSV